MINIHFIVERWKWNEKYNVWVSTEGRVKDKFKKDCKLFTSSRNRYLSVKTEEGVISIHRLVMKTWKPLNDYENMTVDHLNHNCKDNRLINLKWVSEEENLRRAQEDLLDSQDEENKNDICLWQGAVRGSYHGRVINFNSIVEAADFIRKETSNSCSLKKQMEEISKAIYSGNRYFRFRWKGIPAY